MFRTLGYVHLVEAIGGRLGATDAASRLALFIRKTYHGTLIFNGGYDAVTGNESIRTRYADLILFGATFLANPDLPLRFKIGATLNPALLILKRIMKARNMAIPIIRPLIRIVSGRGLINSQKNRKSGFTYRLIRSIFLKKRSFILFHFFMEIRPGSSRYPFNSFTIVTNHIG
jgi:hypothetical protein